MKKKLSIKPFKTKPKAPENFEVRGAAMCGVGPAQAAGGVRARHCTREF